LESPVRLPSTPRLGIPCGTEGSYVVDVVRLPIGPLQDDEDARREIAARVLAGLENAGFHHVRTWRERQRTGINAYPWRSLVRLTAKRLTTDVARVSRENLTPRAKQYEWASVVPQDPRVQAETIADRNASFDAYGDRYAQAMESLRRSSAEELETYFDQVRHMLGRARPQRPTTPRRNSQTPPQNGGAGPQADVGDLRSRSWSSRRGLRDAWIAERSFTTAA
jgi:hypothetical protein